MITLDYVQKELDIKVHHKDVSIISEKIRNLIQSEKILNEFIIQVKRIL